MGKTTSAAGTAAMRAGAALSGTGIGAIVGVPLAAAGGAATLANRARYIINRNRDEADRQARRLRAKRASLGERAKATRTNLWIWSFGFLLYGTLQLMGAFLGLFAFGVMGLADEAGKASHAAASAVLSEEVVNGVGKIANGIAWVAKSTTPHIGNKTVGSYAIHAVTGVDLEAVIDGVGTAINPQTLFLLAELIVLSVGIITLLIASFIYLFSGLKPFSGEKAGTKLGMFFFALFGYAGLVPFLSLIPWFFFWTLVVWRYPK